MSIPKSLNILLLEPFYSGSHKQWSVGLKRYSSHNITLSTLPGRHWKWRMHGAAITFAERHKDDINKYDLVIVSDMCDVATLRGLLKIEAPVLLYFHENQLAYPLSSTDNKNWDRRYVWINFTSALAADRIWFNSEYNRTSFLKGLPEFMHPLPDANKYDIDSLWEKSQVFPLGVDLASLLDHKKKSKNAIPIVLWNHRWEYDKRPEMFFNALFKIAEEGIDFKLVLLGTRTRKYPPIFDEAKKKLEDKILYYGAVENREEYVSLVKKCDLLPVTCIQDFFGISVVEAIAGGVVPLLPQGMAFEEHIPIDHYPELYYRSDDHFYEKLNSHIISPGQYHLKPYVSHYDWKHRIKLYDKNFLTTSGLE